MVPCGGVVSLESTDTVAMDDREVAHAVEFIRARIAEPVNIKDLSQHFSIARRTLERRFRAAMGISLHDFQSVSASRGRRICCGPGRLWPSSRSPAAAVSLTPRG